MEAKAKSGAKGFEKREVGPREGSGAAHTLQEMLTIKSDDIQGRSSAFDSIVKAETLKTPNIPASFNVMLAELRGLALDVDLKNF